MNQRLQISLIVGILVFAIMLFRFLVKKKLNLKYTLIWLIALIGMLLAALFPEIVYWFSRLIGISIPANFMFVVFSFLLLLIVLSLTGIVSHMNERIFKLVQTQAIMEKRIRDLEVQLNKDNQEK